MMGARITETKLHFDCALCGSRFYEARVVHADGREDWICVGDEMDPRDERRFFFMENQPDEYFAFEMGRVFYEICDACDAHMPYAAHRLVYFDGEQRWNVLFHDGVYLWWEHGDANGHEIGGVWELMAKFAVERFATAGTEKFVLDDDVGLPLDGENNWTRFRENTVPVYQENGFPVVTHAPDFEGHGTETIPVVSRMREAEQHGMPYALALWNVRGHYDSFTSWVRQQDLGAWRALP